MAKKVSPRDLSADDMAFYRMPLNTKEDYQKYNDWARMNKIPVKIPGEDSGIHKKVRVKFQRFDQPENVLKARIRNAEIDWKGQLKPGKVYDLPTPVVQFLNSLATPIFEERPIEPGSRQTETVQTGERARFSCQFLDYV